MLLDSNIIIYAAKPEYVSLRHFIAINAPAVSAVSYVEVLGYHLLSELERSYFDLFFQTAQMLQINTTLLNQAVYLRQLRKMSLGDSLIAATALASQRTLITRNTDDFKWIVGLKLLDPLIELEMKTISF